MSKLNENYFETRKKHKKEFKKQKLTLKKSAMNLIIIFTLIFLYSIISKSCDERIERNKKNDMEKSVKINL
jgi:hypothetical protein